MAGIITWSFWLPVYSVEDSMDPCKGNEHVDLAVQCEP